MKIRLLFSFLFSLLLGSAQAVLASPTPSVVIDDQLVGATDRSFFVLRTVTINPGSYYQVTRRLEFLELSVWDGTRRNGCVLRVTTSTQDTEDESWQHAEAELPLCDIAKALQTAGAGYVAPATIYPPNWPVTLTDSGVMIQRDADTAPAELVSWGYVDSRARALSRVEDVALLHREQKTEPTCPFCDIADWFPPTEACVVSPDIAEVPFSGWVFLKFTCWEGSLDMPGANFFIPVSRSTYLGPDAQ